MTNQIIMPTINLEFIPVQFKLEQRTLDGIKFKYNKGKRLYFTGIKNGIRMCEVIKTMQFNEENKEIYIKFGKQSIVIGSYTLEESA